MQENKRCNQILEVWNTNEDSEMMGKLKSIELNIYDGSKE